MDPIKILLVDDSKSARYALRLHLQQHGMQVDTADSAEAALERIPQSRPEAVLMDHTMPGMNGFEALDILKSDASTADIPVVMCTSHDDPAYAAQALKRGALTVLSKADAAERLPAVLDQIRAALAAQPQPTPAPAQAAAAPVAGPTQAEVEGWIEALLARRLTEAVEPQIARLTAQLRQVIAEQVEMAVDALPPPAPALAPEPPPPPVPPAPAIDMDALRNEIEGRLRQESIEPLRRELREELIPAAVRRHFDAERDRLLQLVQQCVDEANAPREEDPGALRRTLDAVDATITPKATQIARQEAQGVVQAALAPEREAIAAMQKRLSTSYALGAAALALAIAAAAAAFLL